MPSLSLNPSAVGYSLSIQHEDGGGSNIATTQCPGFPVQNGQDRLVQSLECVQPEAGKHSEK